MHYLIPLLLIAVALLGHVSTGLWLFNRLHALAWPCRWIKRCEKLVILLTGVVPLVCLARWWNLDESLRQPMNWAIGDAALVVYAMFCLAVGLVASPAWFFRQLTRREKPAALVSNHTYTRRLSDEIDPLPVVGRRMRFFAGLPGNQILRLDIHEKTLRLDRLPPELDGLKIAHLSDIHLTGKFAPEFCSFIVDRTNEWRPDVTVITGDIIEKAACIDWAPDTLGRLQAEDGVYFVLGNHDKRMAASDVARLRQVLTGAGLVDMGAKSLEISLRGQKVLLAGNELPWFPAAEVPPLQSGLGGETSTSSAFRILLSHSPDQIGWARSRGFDLMLAGHTHGGQIRLPLIGPIVAPSRFGVKYASGLFHEPPTLMHVSRGLCGVHPLRYNCPPELALLTLRSAARSSAAGD